MMALKVTVGIETGDQYGNEDWETISAIFINGNIPMMLSMISAIISAGTVREWDDGIKFGKAEEVVSCEFVNVEGVEAIDRKHDTWIINMETGKCTFTSVGMRVPDRLVYTSTIEAIESSIIRHVAQV